MTARWWLDDFRHTLLKLTNSRATISRAARVAVIEAHIWVPPFPGEATVVLQTRFAGPLRFRGGASAVSLRALVLPCGLISVLVSSPYSVFRD
jgi:hypothetical protein